jgi:hypothetical protein
MNAQEFAYFNVGNIADPASALRRDGLDFKTPDGAIWKYRGVTGFRAPELFAKGDIGILQDYEGWVVSLGANCIREFLMWNNTGYGPKSQANYYDLLERHWSERKQDGLYTHAVLFCDQVNGSRVLLSPGEQDAHVHRCVDIARRVGSVILEVVNEDFKNGEISARFPKDWFSGVLTTRSTWQDDQDPQAPGLYLDWVIKHTDRGNEFAKNGKVLHEAERQGLGEYPAANRPAASTEPRRIAEGTNPRQHADDTAVCELFGLGRCLHGGFQSLDGSHESDLQNCRVPTGLSLDCCHAVSEVWRDQLFDPRCATSGRYVRGQADGQGDCPIEHRDKSDDPQHGAIRSYFMFMERDTVAYGLAVDPGPQWTLVPRNGWRVIQQGGYQGNLIRLER